jgi:phosphotransferase system HPr-like phosphotransfer protein
MFSTNQKIPSRKSDIIKMLLDTRDRFESELILRDEREARARVESAAELQSAQSELNLARVESAAELQSAQSELSLRDERESRIRAESTISLLSLQLEIANMKIDHAKQ